MKKNITQNAIKNFLIFISVWIMILSGVYIVNSAVLPLYNRAVTVNITATGEQNPKALGNNVRLSDIKVNGQELNLGKLEYTAESTWKYDSANDFLYAYDLDGASELLVNLPGVHSLELTFVEEVGSGCVNIYVNGKLLESRDLYADTDWKEVPVKCTTSIWVFPEEHGAVWLITFGIALLLTVGIIKLNKNQKNTEIISVRTILHAFLALFLELLAVFVQYGTVKDSWVYISGQLHLFIKTAILIFLVMQLLTCITKRVWISFGITAVVVIFLETVSNIKFSNRGMPLLPWDVSMAKEALSVAGNYEIAVSLPEIAALLIAVGVSILLFFLAKATKKGFCILQRLVTGIVICLCMVFYVYTGFVQNVSEESDITYRTFKVEDQYEARGFVPAFLEYLSYVNPADKPQKYNETTMDTISAKYADGSAAGETQQTETPNIIAIMSESFWDASRLNTIKLDEPLLPVYENLKKEGMYGELFSHVLNGGTVVSEFEFLTGFSGEFFPSDYMVYGNYLKKDFYSAVGILKNQGYATMAFHPYTSSNYNRENAYLKMGFDQRFFEDSFEDTKIIRNYISDESMYKKMISEYENRTDKTQPVFMFGVTMQNHGGYWKDSIYEEKKVGFSTDVYGEVATDCLEDQLTGLHESDRALGELVDYFRTADQNTIIIYFGDHVSDAGPKNDRALEKSSWNEDELEYDYETHKVPFLVWSNYNNNSEDAGIMEMGELLPTVFEKYNIKSTEFWNYLLTLKNCYSAADSSIVISKDQTYRDIAEMSEEEAAMHEEYKLLQYDYIFGKQYAEEFWKY